MQLSVVPFGRDDHADRRDRPARTDLADLADDLSPENQQGEDRGVDDEMLRILASWIAQRDGLDPVLGAPVDRAFVVLPSPTPSASRAP